MIKFVRHISKVIIAATLLCGASFNAAYAQSSDRVIIPMTQAQNAPVILVAEALLQKQSQPNRKKISASKAKSIAIAHVGGGKAQGISTQGGAFKVRVLKKNGEVVDVLVDARSGRVKN